jgi:hypothetical protein
MPSPAPAAAPTSTVYLIADFGLNILGPTKVEAAEIPCLDAATALRRQMEPGGAGGDEQGGGDPPGAEFLA